MAIDKQSTGFPEVGVHRPATKVNMWMIAAILTFLAVATVAALLTARQAASPAGGPASATEKR